MLFAALLMLQATLFAQPDPNPSPAVKDFAGTLSFLASGWMEGREAGTRGGFMAADYIASMMQLNGLVSFGNQKQHSYFQDFEVLKYKTGKAALAIIQRNGPSHSALQLVYGIDFDVSSGPRNVDAEAPLVFAGYGISAAGNGYDDYKGLNVKGKIVIVLDGFPGDADTNSIAWRKFGKLFGAGKFSPETKLRLAKKHGAIALLQVTNDADAGPFQHSLSNQVLLSSAMNSDKPAEPDYGNTSYILPHDTANAAIPYFRLGKSASEQLMDGTGINLAVYRKNAARLSAPSLFPVRDKVIKFSVTVKTESLLVRNVLGILPGKDSTKTIIIGAHYDHLGMRDNVIYYGSDDNASGVAGMLALAANRAQRGIKPPCNILFASWTAEEKGLLGSAYFVQQMDTHPENILLYINLDMISRSVASDTARRQLSIGTRTEDGFLREMARKRNTPLSRPFELDLWDVTGHSGSDYASFTERNIPIMTYNSGLHDDYHTPRDIAANADPEKMKDILKVVNGCLQDFLEGKRGK